MKRNHKTGWIKNKKYLIRGMVGIMCLNTVLSSGGVVRLANNIFKPVSVYAMSVNENAATVINISNVAITNGQIIVNITENGIYRLTGSNLINDAYVDVIVTVNNGVTADIILDGVTIKNNDRVAISYEVYSECYTPFVINGTANIYIKNNSSVYGYYSAFEVSGTLNFMESENDATLSIGCSSWGEGSVVGSGSVKVSGSTISMSKRGIMDIGSFVMEDGKLTAPCVTAGEITISGGRVETTGYEYYAGIGSGSTECRSIVISGGTVIARGGWSHGAGIGASNGAKCGTIKITDGYVEAYKGSEYARSDIGAGYTYAPDSVTIDGGFVVGNAWYPVNSRGESVYSYTLAGLKESAVVSQIGSVVCADVTTNEAGELITYLPQKDVVITCDGVPYPYTYHSGTDRFVAEGEVVVCTVTFEDEEGNVIGTVSCESGKCVELPISDQYDYTCTYNEQPFTEETPVNGNITVKVSKELKKFTLSYVNGKESEKLSYGTALSEGYLYVDESKGRAVSSDSVITCDLTAYPVMVEDNVQYLSLGSEEELLGFKHLVDDFLMTNLNAKITANIECDQELGIGGESPYNGIFDGQGYTLSKMTWGLFEHSNGTIRNVSIKDSNITNTIAAICITNFENGVIENCYNGADLTGDANMGGICAFSDGIIRDCYNTGTITSKKYVAAGIVIHLWENGVVESCYNYGAVTGSNGNGAIVAEYDDDVVISEQIKNCYYLSEAENESSNGATGKTAEQFASGEVAYLLNGSTSEGSLVWGQKLTGDDKQAYPVPGGETVYVQKNYTKCDKSDEPVCEYSNDKKEDAVPEHELNGGACTGCGSPVVFMKGEETASAANAVNVLEGTIYYGKIWNEVATLSAELTAEFLGEELEGSFVLMDGDSVIDGTAVVPAGEHVLKVVFKDNEGNSYTVCEVKVEVQVVSVTEDPVDEFVERMYTIALGREADEAGLSFWTNELKEGKRDGATVAKGFILSPEMERRNLSNEQFVITMYQTFFNRTPKDGDSGKAFWVNLLDNGVSRAYVFRGFCHSAEFQALCNNYGITRGTITLTENRDKNADITMYVYRCYDRALNRQPDTAGLNFWTGAIINRDRTPVDVAGNFIFSAEFKKMNLSNEEYIEVLYNMFFDRASDEAGFNFWLTEMNSGRRDRYKVFTQFANSAEFKAVLAKFGL